MAQRLFKVRNEGGKVGFGFCRLSGQRGDRLFGIILMQRRNGRVEFQRIVLRLMCAGTYRRLYFDIKIVWIVR